MFSFFKKPKTAVIHTYNHIMGYREEEFSLDEQDIIANSASTIIKVLKNKLMVVAIFGMNNATEKEMFKTQWKRELINELIWHFTFYKEELEKDRWVIPVDGQNF